MVLVKVYFWAARKDAEKKKILLEPCAPREELKGYFLGLLGNIPGIDIEKVIPRDIDSDFGAEVHFFIKRPNAIKTEEGFRGWVIGILSLYLPPGIDIRGVEIED